MKARVTQSRTYTWAYDERRNENGHSLGSNSKHNTYVRQGAFRVFRF